MTEQKAIKVLSELHDQCCQADSIFCTDTTGARCEAVDMAISALEKQIPKKPVYKNEIRFAQNYYAWYSYCPHCGHEITPGDMHCIQCGQAIDWMEGE